MSEQEKINPGHRTAVKVLCIVGPVVLALGLICTLISLVDFFSAGGPPKLFWLGFVGLPLIFAGSVMTMMGFAGKIARFHAAQYAPVAKDTFNYMAEGTQDGVQTVARSIVRGIYEAGTVDKTAADSSLTCPGCGFVETADAAYCSGCGAALAGRPAK